MATSTPARIVKIYGTKSVLFGLLNPLMTSLMTSRGVPAPIEPQARVLEDAERDGQRLANEGYRVVRSDWYELPLLRIPSLRVTYELESRPR